MTDVLIMDIWEHESAVGAFLILLFFFFSRLYTHFYFCLMGTYTMYFLHEKEGMTKKRKSLMRRQPVSTITEVKCDKESLLMSSLSGEQFVLANTIKSFHYHLQRRMLDETSDGVQNEGQKGTEDKEDVVRRWFDLISKEGESMKGYSTAMHDIATCYWDFHKEKNEGVSRVSLDVSSAFRGMAHTRLPRKRGSEKIEGTGNHGQSPVMESLRYNDRVEYSIHCVEDYYLGSCLPFPYADEQGQPEQERVHETGFFRSSVAKPLFGTADGVIYMQLPRIAAIAVKEWRRAFYTTNGRQATAQEVEVAAYDALASLGSGIKGGLCDMDLKMTAAAANTNGGAGLLTCCQAKAKKSAASLAASYILLTRAEMWRSNKLACDLLREPPPLQVLDVGSCYGPFKGKTVTNGILRVPLAVTALDLCPFEGSEVIQGDWLAVRFYDWKDDNTILKGVESDDDVSCTTDEYSTVTHKRLFVWHRDESDDLKESFIGRPLLMACGQFDVVFFCLMLSFLPHPKLRYRACLHAHLALRDGGLLVIVSTRTQGSRCGSWIADWIACIEGIGFKRVHKNIMGQIVGMSFSKENVADFDGDIECWIGRMMARPEAEGGLYIIGDDCHQQKKRLH